MHATNELMLEHQGIELMLEILEAVTNRMDSGEAVPTWHLDGILEFLTIFVDKCHHGKEEEFLFPAMETAGVLRTGGPIGVLLQEHEQGRKLVGRIKKLLTEHDPAGHPGMKEAQATVVEYVQLMIQHIAKENTVVFPMADKMLDAGTAATLCENFEKLERERIGAGKHEEFHALLDTLQDVYLK